MCRFILLIKKNLFCSEKRIIFFTENLRYFGYFPKCRYYRKFRIIFFPQ